MSKWPLVQLSDVAEIERDSIQASAIADGTHYVGLENIVSGGDFLDVREVAEGELASSKFQFTSAHLLYGKLRPYLAKIARPTFSGICSTDILPVLPGAKLSRDYLSHYLRQQEMVDLANARASGANLPRLSPKVLVAFEIPLPPLAEQRRIAAILDQAEILRAQRRAAIAQLDSLGQAIFLEMFGDPRINPNRWPCAPLVELGRVVTGNTPSRAKPDYYGSAVEWVKSDNINTPGYFLTQAAEGLSELGRAVGRTVPADSILVTCIAGSPACIGNAAMTNREVAFNQQINGFVPKKTNPHYAYMHLVVGKELIQTASTNGMKGMVSKSRFEQVALMQPPADLQALFAERIQSVESLRTAHRAALSCLDELFASLQHCAFSGEL